MILRNYILQQAFTVYMENSLQFEISLWSIWPKWNLHRSEFHYARSHVNADNEVTSHWSEILPRSETGLSYLLVSCKRALTFLVFPNNSDSISYLICLNLLNSRSEMWRRSLAWVHSVESWFKLTLIFLISAI